MRKNFFLIILSLFITLNFADAKILNNKYDKVLSKNISAIKVDKDKKEITKFLSQMTKYANKKDINSIKNMYDKKYVSADGFDFETYMKLTEETFKSYPNIKYRTRLDDLVLTPNYAIARMSDYTTVEIDSDINPEDKKGKLETICKYSTYLVKRDEGWKIIYDEVEFEESTLKFGDAKKSNIRLVTPLFIEKNKDYEISLTVDLPKDTFAMASISNEEITYPDKSPKESFRKIKSEEPLERVVRANKNGNNEYVMASIGYTKVSIKEDKASSLINFAFKFSGTAFVMRRVNLAKKNFDVENLK